MSDNELITIEPETIKQVIDAPKELSFDDLPPLLPQQQRMLNAIIGGDNYTDAYRKAGYSSVEYADRSAWLMISKNPLKAWLEYYSATMSKICTPEYIVSKLNRICDQATNNNENGFTNPDIAIKALAEINKMRGNYAQQVLQVNNINASVQDIRQARQQYKKDK